MDCQFHLAKHCTIRKLQAFPEEPSDERLQGRVGFIRLKVPGVLDLGCGNMYLPCGRRFADRQLYQDALSWMHTCISALPLRCSPIVFTDANARLGSVPLENHHQQVLIGQVRPQNESANRSHFRDFLATTNLQAPTTIWESAARPTWSAGYF